MYCHRTHSNFQLSAHPQQAEGSFYGIQTEFWWKYKILKYLFKANRSLESPREGVIDTTDAVRGANRVLVGSVDFFYCNLKPSHNLQVVSNCWRLRWRHLSHFCLCRRWQDGIIHYQLSAFDCGRMSEYILSPRRGPTKRICLRNENYSRNVSASLFPGVTIHVSLFTSPSSMSFEIKRRVSFASSIWLGRLFLHLSLLRQIIFRYDHWNYLTTWNHSRHSLIDWTKWGYIVYATIKIARGFHWISVSTIKTRK